MELLSAWVVTMHLDHSVLEGRSRKNGTTAIAKAQAGGRNLNSCGENGLELKRQYKQVWLWPVIRVAK